MSHFVLVAVLSIAVIFWARTGEAEKNRAKRVSHKQPTLINSNRKVKCGIANPHVLKISRRIVGGKVAARAEFPWQVRLENEGYFCGGILIHERWVLTAAHCFFSNKVPSAWHGTLGEHDVESEEGSEMPVTFDSLIIHKRHNEMTLENDIALLRIDKSKTAPFTRYINPVCVPLMGESFHGNCTVSGWGLDSEGDMTRHLHKAVVPILSKEKCTSLLKPHFIPESMLCAGHEKGGIDTCKGDSGGPLVCNKNGTWKVAGIISWGKGCDNPKNSNSPGVYTDVTYFRDWINRVSKKCFTPGLHHF